MFEIIRLSGPWGLVLSALILLNLGLVTWSLTSLLGAQGKIGPGVRNRINAVLFWGIFGAVAGILGQVNGIYLALRIISAAPEISPPVIMEGFTISFLPTIMGLFLLLASALAWMVLRSLLGRRLGQEMPA